MLGDLYYTLGLIPLIMTLAIIIKFKEYSKVNEWFIKFEEVTRKKPKKSDYRTPDEYTLFTGVSGIIIIDSIWIVLGILTQSWYLFVLTAIIIGISNLIRKSIGMNVISNTIWLVTLIGKFFIYLYLIINHFHLHYDTWVMIKNFIK